MPGRGHPARAVGWKQRCRVVAHDSRTTARCEALRPSLNERGHRNIEYARQAQEGRESRVAVSGFDRLQSAAVEAGGEVDDFLGEVLPQPLRLNPCPHCPLMGTNPVVVFRQVTGHSTNPLPA